MPEPTPLALVVPKTPENGTAKPLATPESWRQAVADLQGTIATAKREAREAVQALGRPDPSDHVALMAWRITVAQTHPEETARLRALYAQVDRDEAALAELRAQLARYDNPADDLERYGVLREHRGARLADFPAVALTVQRWLDGEATSARTSCLLVNGPVGTGKSHLAAAVLSDVARRETLGQTAAPRAYEPEHARFMLARRLLTDLWHEGADGGSHAMRVLGGLPWLVIDDLGHEGRVSEGSLGAFHELLSIRCGNFERTIVTTNLSLDEIAASYDPSIASRLGAWTQIVLTGPDRRRA